MDIKNLILMLIGIGVVGCLLIWYSDNQGFWYSAIGNALDINIHLVVADITIIIVITYWAYSKINNLIDNMKYTDKDIQEAMKYARRIHDRILNEAEIKRIEQRELRSN
jgi:hypothetical protein